MRSFLLFLRKCFFAGVLAILPLYLTFFIVRWVVKTIDNMVLPLLPESFLLNDIHGAGLLIIMIFFFVIGFFVANRWGAKFIRFYDPLLERVPFLGNLYTNIKGVLEKFISGDNTKSFSEAVLVEYPSKDIWVIGFITNHDAGAFSNVLGKDMLTIFIPFVPLPTQGILFMVHRRKIKKLDMKVQDALSYMVSLGVMQKKKRRNIITK